MTTPEFKQFLLWSIGVNYLVLVLWFVAFLSAHDWMYRLHSRWFKISVETFDTIHYLGMATYKIGVLLFFVAPLIALCISS